MNAHQCETWQMMESAKGGWYCGACGKHEAPAQVIPEAAVEAAARAIFGLRAREWSVMEELTCISQAKRALAAAATHMLADAWDAGCWQGYREGADDELTLPSVDNPYRPTP